MDPLLGDGQGVYRIKITGNSGSGKTTLGNALATRLGVPYISLDTLYWKPGWEETPVDEFREKVRQALQSSPGWVVDGTYNRKLGSIIDDQSTDIIWLDPPLMLYFPRLFWRTMLRLFRIGAPCATGCHETFYSVFLQKNGILWWCLSHHWYVQRVNGALMRRIGMQTGIDCHRMRKIGGWGSELRKWWDDVEKMISRNNR